VNFLARIVAIVTWKHWAWAIAIGIGWPTLNRISMVRNYFDGFTLEAWVYGVLVTLVVAHLYVLAIVIAEASESARRAPSPSRYAVVMLGAAAIHLALTLHVIPGFLNAPANAEGQRILWDHVSGRVDLPTRKARFFLYQLLLAAMGTSVYVWLRRSSAAERALADAQLSRAEAQRRLESSRLASAAEAVDPQAVLVRLAEIESAYESDHPRADVMMDELIAYLRAAIPKLRLEAGAPQGG
jgi:hypothetical protein